MNWWFLAGGLFAVAVFLLISFASPRHENGCHDGTNCRGCSRGPR